MPAPPSPVITRFAPSPTGHLHVGGARTALFSWAFARRHGGKFILRVEDTDQARSSAESARSLIEDLQWLGLAWDEGPDPAADDPYAASVGGTGPYFQSQRLDTYRAAVDRLRPDGRAYDDAGAVRFLMPGKGITVRDEVLGEVSIARDQLEDFVILKGDGYPTFHLAVVVDDALMGTTHVLRGQEHLMNTPRHVALQEALGYPVPAYAHLPAILNADGSKMSKRDQAKAARAAAQAWLKNGDGVVEALAEAADVPPAPLGAFLNKESDDLGIARRLAAYLGVALPEINVQDFRRSGYLPGVLLNYLALLGWSPPDANHERFDLDYLVANFGLDRVGKSNARFDRGKLLAFNAEALAAMPAEAFLAQLRDYLRDYHPDFLAEFDGPRLQALAEMYRPRLRTLGEIVTAAAFFAAADDGIAYDPKAVDKVLRKKEGAGFASLAALRDALAGWEPWTAETIHQRIEAFARETRRGMGDVAQPLRVAVSGTSVSPAIHDTLFLLGRDAVRARIDRCLRTQGAGV